MLEAELGDCFLLDRKSLGTELYEMKMTTELYNWSAEVLILGFPQYSFCTAKTTFQHARVHGLISDR